MWPIGRADFVKALAGGEVRGSNPTDSKTILINKPKRPIPGCHVAAHDWATWHPIICPITATCRITFTQLPTNTLPHHHVWSIHITYGQAMSACTDMPRQHPYGLHSQHPFFYLFDDSNRSRYLSLPTSV
jgi:hypothetical protein